MQSIFKLIKIHLIFLLLRFSLLLDFRYRHFFSLRVKSILIAKGKKKEKRKIVICLKWKRRSSSEFSTFLSLTHHQWYPVIFPFVSNGHLVCVREWHFNRNQWIHQRAWLVLPKSFRLRLHIFPGKAFSVFHRSFLFPFSFVFIYYLLTSWLRRHFSSQFHLAKILSNGVNGCLFIFVVHE